MQGSISLTACTATIAVFLSLQWSGMERVQAAETVLQVTVSGLTPELLDNVLGQLDIYQERSQARLTPARIELLHRQAPRQIERALHPFGFYRVLIETHLLRPDPADSKPWQAIYQIDPGEPIDVVRVDYQVRGEGGTDPVFPNAVALAVGSTLNHQAYEQCKAELIETAVESGYLDARLERNEIIIDLDRYSAEIVLHLDTGPIYAFGETRFTGTTLDAGLLARFVPFNAGDGFSHRSLLLLQRNLLNSNFFDQVEIVPERERADGGRIPVRVSLTMAKSNRYRAGAGYSTDSGARLNLDWTIRHIGTRGHRARVETHVAASDLGLEAGYQIPLRDPVTDYLEAKAVFSDYDTTGRQGTLGRAGILHSVAVGSWRRNIGLELQRESSTVAEVAADTQELVSSVSWTKTVADHSIYTSNGYRLKFGLHASAAALLSDSSYLQGTVGGKLIRSFGERLRLLARVDLGATLAGDVEALPATRRFFAGGDLSVRGYALDELGPTDSAGSVLGGRYLATGSLELELKVIENWSAALFYDVGGAYDPDLDNHIASGLGFGVRRRTPIGQIRIDVAVAVSEPGKPIQLHLTIGPDL